MQHWYLDVFGMFQIKIIYMSPNLSIFIFTYMCAALIGRMQLMYGIISGGASHRHCCRVQFIDDVEFWFPPGNRSLVEYRSASRSNGIDFSFNRKRIKVRLELILF